MDAAPEWVSKQPYNPRQLAVFQAFEAHKVAVKLKNLANFISCKNTSQILIFYTNNWQNQTFYP
jgi:putative transposase